MTGSTALVNFIVAGVQKGGTTALFDYLSDETGISLSRTKEVHFFDDDARDWAQPAYEDYHANFDLPDGRVRGEATPIYLYWPGSLERIAAYNPAMRLIVTLRDPVERAWSHWRMERARGTERQSFTWCIRQGRARLFEAQPWGHHREFSYVERGYYGEQLERVFALFPKDQVLVLRSADLRADPGEALAAVRRFLDLPPGASPESRESHVGVETDATMAPEDAAHLRAIYAADQARMKALVGFDFAD